MKNMEKIGVGLLIVIVATLTWTLPAMAEKFALSDDDLDRISAGGNEATTETTTVGPGASASAAAASVGTDSTGLTSILGSTSFKPGGWGNIFLVNSTGVKAKAKGKANHISRSRSFAGAYRYQ